MSHRISFIEGVPAFSFATKESGGEGNAWHMLGQGVHADALPIEFIRAANLDKYHFAVLPANAVTVSGAVINTGWGTLYRMYDNQHVDMIPLYDDESNRQWHWQQHADSMESVANLVIAGDHGSVSACGVLDGGKRAFISIRLKDSSVELFGHDRIDSHLTFINSVQYGVSIKAMTGMIRVVCANTEHAALKETKNKASISHRYAFDAEQILEMVGVARERLAQYRDVAAFLGSRRYTVDSMAEYFQTVFPSNSSKKPISKLAGAAQDVLFTQPGAQYGEGTFWQLLNACTYVVDHVAGRAPETRFSSAIDGKGAADKNRAWQTAVDMATLAPAD